MSLFSKSVYQGLKQLAAYSPKQLGKRLLFLIRCGQTYNYVSHFFPFLSTIPSIKPCCHGRRPLPFCGFMLISFTSPCLSKSFHTDNINTSYPSASFSLIYLIGVDSSLALSHKTNTFALFLV